MKDQVHPILIDLAKQLPIETQTLQFIEESKSYEEIAGQARKEMYCLGNLENVLDDGQTGETILFNSGYEVWLKDAEDDDRLRLIGALKLIAEFCEEIDED